MAKQSAPTSSMRYDPAAVAKGSTMLEHYPELAVLPDFEAYGKGENDCYARLAVLYAAHDSPYRDLPLDDKKLRCMNLAGVPADDPRRADIMAYADKGFVAMANACVRQTNWLEYGLVYHGLESAWQTVQGLSEPIKKGEMDEAKYQTATKTRKDNLDAMMEQVPALVERRNQLFLGDEELAKTALASQAARTGIVQRRSEGESFVD